MILIPPLPDRGDTISCLHQGRETTSYWTVSAPGTPSFSSQEKMFHYAETISWRHGIDETGTTREQAGKAAVLAGAC